MVTVADYPPRRKTIETTKPWHVIRRPGWSDQQFRDAQSVRGTISAAKRRASTRDRDRRICKQFRAGVPRREIADAEGVSVRQVHRIATRTYRRRPVRLHPDVALVEFLRRHPHLMARWRNWRRFPVKAGVEVGRVPFSTARTGNAVSSPSWVSCASDTARARPPTPPPWSRPLSDWEHALAGHGVKRRGRRALAAACPLCGGRDRLHVRDTGGGRVIGGCRGCVDGRPDGRRRWYRIAVALFGRDHPAGPVSMPAARLQTTPAALVRPVFWDDARRWLCGVCGASNQLPDDDCGECGTVADLSDCRTSGGRPETGPQASRQANRLSRYPPDAERLPVVDFQALPGPYRDRRP